MGYCFPIKSVAPPIATKGFLVFIRMAIGEVFSLSIGRFDSASQSPAVYVFIAKLGELCATISGFYSMGAERIFSAENLVSSASLPKTWSGCGLG